MGVAREAPGHKMQGDPAPRTVQVQGWCLFAPSSKRSPDRKGNLSCKEKPPTTEMPPAPGAGVHPWAGVSEVSTELSAEPAPGRALRRLERLLQVHLYSHRACLKSSNKKKKYIWDETNRQQRPGYLQTASGAGVSHPGLSQSFRSGFLLPQPGTEGLSLPPGS